MLADYRWLIELAVATLTAFAGWMAGRRQRNNVFLAELQGSIDTLAQKNSEQMNEILKCRQEIIEQRTENLSLKTELSQVRTENERLNEQMTALREENRQLNEKVSILTEQLANVKTITKVK